MPLWALQSIIQSRVAKIRSSVNLDDGNFRSDAQRRRDGIVLALNKAIDNADRLKAKCERAGIDHNTRIRNMWNLEDEALSDADIKAKAEYHKAFKAALAIVPPEAFNNAELVLATPSDHGSEKPDFSGPSERTEIWVDAISQEQYRDEGIDEPKASGHA
jgi:hypothetical protein